MQLDGRVGLVTGASRGIGRATALALAERGAAVVVAARTVRPGGRLSGSLAETVADIVDAGGEAFSIACDLNDDSSVTDLAAAALAWKGHVDVLVNNAAYLGKATFHTLDELTLANWNRQLNVNVTAPLLLAQEIVPTMRKAGAGVIVNITSAAAELEEGDVPGISYGTTKAALNRLTMALARDLRPDHIAVFAVDPGYVRTEIAEQAAENGAWSIDINDAHLPAVSAAAIADLVERDLDEVSGRVWCAVGAGPPLMRHDGRDGLAS
jgi:NAD(P)-dependent dehydrogenase (short-subunit alcohol dehydrogenase family)